MTIQLNFWKGKHSLTHTQTHSQNTNTLADLCSNIQLSLSLFSLVVSIFWRTQWLTDTITQLLSRTTAYVNNISCICVSLQRQYKSIQFVVQLIWLSFFCLDAFVFETLLIFASFFSILLKILTICIILRAEILNWLRLLRTRTRNSDSRIIYLFVAPSFATITRWRKPHWLFWSFNRNLISDSKDTIFLNSTTNLSSFFRIGLNNFV